MKPAKASLVKRDNRGRREVIIKVRCPRGYRSKPVEPITNLNELVLRTLQKRQALPKLKALPPAPCRPGGKRGVLEHKKCMALESFAIFVILSCQN